jgi:ABC-type oligopeptide transport system ATPase subunit
MSGAIEVIGALLLRIFDLIMQAVIKDQEAKKRYLEFVEKASKNNTSAAKLHMKTKAQLEKLREAKNAEREIQPTP